MRRLSNAAITSLMALTLFSGAAYAYHKGDGPFGGRSSPFVTPDDSDFGRNNRAPARSAYAAELEKQVKNVAIG
jgi:hypothetical protein